MATTENGIYYPDDKTKKATILSDLQKMAKSIDTAINNNKFDPTQINNSIQELETDISDLQESQEEQNSDIEALTNALPSETQEGENINLKGTIPAKFKEFKLSGNSKQETRSGKNLINVLKETLTTNGITFTNNKDGSITINGTATDTAFFPMLEQTFTLKQGQTYSAYLGGTTEGIAMTIRTLSSNQGLIFLQNAQETVTSTYNGETVDDAYAYIRVEAGTTLNNVTVYPMLVEGSEVGEYEPYGAMPSPEFPSEIQNVEGNVNVSVCNKNIADPEEVWENMQAYNSSYCSEVVEDGRECIRFNNVMYRPTVSNPFNLINYNYKENTAYTIRALFKHDSTSMGSGNQGVVFGVAYTDGTVQYATPWLNKEDGWQENRIVTNSFKTIARIGFEYQSSAYWFLDKGSLFIAEGDTTDYVEHQEQNVLFSLAQGQKLMLGDYLASDGIHHVRKQDTVTGTTKVFEDAKENGSYMCNIKEAGILNGKTITFNESVTNAIVEYELVEEEIEAYTEEQQEAYNQLKELQAYEEETNVYSTNEISPIFEVTAIKDINSVITQLNQLILENGGN